MEQYDIKKTSADLANSAGLGVAAILLFAILSVRQAFPPTWMAAGCVLFGLAVRQLAYFLLVPWYMSRYGKQDMAEAVLYGEMSVSGEPEWIILPPWFGQIDWPAIVRYLRGEEQPVLSRRTMVDYVNQRAYSPLDGGQSFPDFMVAIGAARRAGIGYEWLPDAVTVVEKLLRESSPTPSVSRQAGYVTS